MNNEEGKHESTGGNRQKAKRTKTKRKPLAIPGINYNKGNTETKKEGKRY